jgi:SNF2 family DNA or RNA helicase
MTALTPVQIEALRRSANKKGFCQWLEMGLGKTLVALQEFQNLVDADRVVSRLVVICPNSFKGGWREEIEKHGFDFDVHVVETDKVKAAQEFVSRATFTKPPVLVVHYQGVRLPHIRNLVEKFKEGRFVMLVIDESIALKDPRAQQTQAVFGIARGCSVVRMLSGKPQTQGPCDLWSQLYLTGATEGQSYWSFKNTYCRLGGWKMKEIVGTQNEGQLQKRMSPYAFIAKKEDWLVGMPEKVYTTRRYALTPILAQKYAEMEKLFVTWVETQGGKERVSVEIAVTKYQKLSQITAGFIHNEDGTAKALVPDKDNPRLHLLADVLDEIEGKVAVVFVNRYIGDQLWRFFGSRHMQPAIIIGDMKTEEVQHHKHRFNNDPACKVILLQAVAGKYGHTILGDQLNVGDACSHMIFYQSSYSLDDRSQVEDRIHRMGQRASACTYVDLAGSEMDYNVLGALQRKESLYQKIMGMAGSASARAA